MSNKYAISMDNIPVFSPLFWGEEIHLNLEFRAATQSPEFRRLACTIYHIVM